MDKKEKNNKMFTLLKKTTIAAVIGHAVAILFLFLTSTALAKNEDPSSLMPVAALMALLIGALVCGFIAGKTVDGAFGGAITGLIFSGLLIIISLLLGAFSPAGEAVSQEGYGIGFKIGMLAGATVISSLIGLWINGRKDSRKSIAKQRKKAIGR